MYYRMARRARLVLELFGSFVFTVAGIAFIAAYFGMHGADNSWVALVLGGVFFAAGVFSPWVFWRRFQRSRFGPSAAEASDGATPDSEAGCRRMRNEPGAWTGWRLPAGSEVVARTPEAFRFFAAGGAVLFGAVSGYLAINHAAEVPMIVRYGLYFLAVITIPLALRLLGLRWIYFAASSEGIYLPDSQPITKDTEWLSIPWMNVQDVRKELMLVSKLGETGSTRRYGIRLYLRLQEDEAKRYLGAAWLRHRLLKRADEDTFPVGFTDAFIKVDELVPRLQDLWRAART